MKSNKGANLQPAKPGLTGLQGSTVRVMRKWLKDNKLSIETLAEIIGKGYPTTSRRIGQGSKFRGFDTEELRRLWEWCELRDVPPPDFLELITG